MGSEMCIRDSAAGAAPGGPEVDEDGLVGHVLHGVLKVGIGRGEDEFAHDFL